LCALDRQWARNRDPFAHLRQKIADIPLDFGAQGSVYRLNRREITMQSENLKRALSAVFPLITGRLKMAHNIATAAEICASSDNHDGAFRILLDVEQLTYEATTLLNAASLIRRESED
jgi:hypothetical protein